MSRNFFFLIISIFSFQQSLGGWTGDETKQLWRESEFDLDLYERINQKLCYESRKSFVNCLVAFHNLLGSPNDNPHQLVVSDLNELKIIPFPEKMTPKKLEELLESEKQRKESFHKFTLQWGWTEKQAQPPQATVPQHIVERFDDISGQVREFVKTHIPEPDQPYYLGMSHNKYLKETLGPHAQLFPPELMRNKSTEYVGVGMIIQSYKTDHEDLNGLVVIDPFDGSSAQLSGLKKGDFITAVDGVSIKGQSLKDVVKAIKGSENIQVKLTVRSFCDNNKEKDVFVTRKPTTSPTTNWTETSRFINLRQQEPLDCEEPVDKGGPQALYLPLKSFIPTKDSENSDDNGFRFCGEFVDLQQKDLGNPRSFGMIIDLRGNPGGNLFTVSCMLNTIIGGNEIMVKEIPVEDGQVIPGRSRNSYFTDKGVIAMHSSNGVLPMSYNKPIIVLVDRNSASASEIFAGTIQDMKRGWVVGDRTFGKGSVQQVTPFSFGGQISSKLHFKQTKAIYVLNSGRSPQNFGIIPDFRFSHKGEPIAMEDETSKPVSLLNLFYDSIPFENNQWEQNRPDEVAKLTACIHKDNKMGSDFRQKIETDERYNRPFVGDYPLELAKDVIMCSPITNIYKEYSEFYDPYQHPYVRHEINEAPGL